MTDVPPLPYSVDEPKGGRPGHGRGFGSGAGRRPGTQSKITVALKEAILLAAETVGDKLADAAADAGEPERQGGLAGYLEMVASTDVKSFCGLLGKVLPMQITGKDGSTLEVVFRTVYEGATPAAGDA